MNDAFLFIKFVFFIQKCYDNEPKANTDTISCFYHNIVGGNRHW